MRSKVCLYGASGHGKVIKDIAESNNIEVAAFIDDEPKSDTLHEIEVIKFSEIESLVKENFIISIGNNKVRKKISESIKVNFTSLVDKTAIISKFSSINEGTVVMPSAVVNSDTNIGKHCIVNTGAVIEHDCIIEDYVHISPNATITGGVSIGEGTHVGTGAIVIPGVNIGNWVTIGAGAVIIKDVPDNAVVVGNPGKVIKYNK